MKVKREERKVCELMRECIIQNAQKGALFRVKFINDPMVYMGIPLAHPGTTPSDSLQFEFKILEPEAKKGMFLCSYKNLELIEELNH